MTFVYIIEDKIQLLRCTQNLFSLNIITIDTKYSTLSEWIENLKEFQLDSLFATKSLGRAYEYISKVDPISIEENRISAKIVGASEYNIKLTKVGDQIIGECTCPMDIHCKHLAALLISRMRIEY